MATLPVVDEPMEGLQPRLPYPEPSIVKDAIDVITILDKDSPQSGFNVGGMMVWLINAYGQRHLIEFFDVCKEDAVLGIRAFEYLHRSKIDYEKPWQADFSEGPGNLLLNTMQVMSNVVAFKQWANFTVYTKIQDDIKAMIETYQQKHLQLLVAQALQKWAKTGMLFHNLMPTPLGSESGNSSCDIYWPHFQRINDQMNALVQSRYMAMAAEAKGKGKGKGKGKVYAQVRSKGSQPAQSSSWNSQASLYHFHHAIVFIHEWLVGYLNVLVVLLDL
jgi:hypothetical protein